MPLLEYYNPRTRGEGAGPGGVDRSPVIFFSCLAAGIVIMGTTGAIGDMAFVAGTAAAVGLSLAGFVLALMTGVRRRRL